MVTPAYKRVPEQPKWGFGGWSDAITRLKQKAGFTTEAGGGYLQPEAAADSLQPNVASGAAPVTSAATTDEYSTERPSVGQIMAGMRADVQAPAAVTSTPVAEQIKSNTASMAPQKISGLGQDYYDRQREAMKDSLRQEFFGPMGVLQNKASSESAGGRLGSGVGNLAIQESVMNPFAQGVVDIEGQVLQKQAEEASRVETFNATQQADFERFSTEAYNNALLTDSSNAMEAANANADRAAQYESLLGTLAQAEAGLISAEQGRYAEQQLQLLIASEQARQADQQAALQATQTSIDAVNSANELVKDMKANGMTASEAKEQIRLYGESYPGMKDALEASWQGLYQNEQDEALSAGNSSGLIQTGMTANGLPMYRDPNTGQNYIQAGGQLIPVS